MIKLCHFVRDDHKTAPFFLSFLFLKQTLSEFEGYIVSALPYHSKQEWDFEIECLQASQKCPFDISDKKLKNKTERSAISSNPVFIVVLAQRRITN